MSNQSNAQKLNTLQDLALQRRAEQKGRAYVERELEELRDIAASHKVRSKTRIDRMIELGTVLMFGAMLGMFLVIANS
jgi:hypothetical protein